MGSLEDDELVQMVKDFIESDSSTPAASSTDTFHLSNSHQTIFSALQDILGSGTEVEREVFERVLKYMVQSKREVKTSGDSLKKWLVMRLRMDGFNASLCHTSLVNSFGCLAGDYEYIDVVVTEFSENCIGNTKRLIVDTELKSQFEVARPTQAYKQLIESLPPVFVGSEEKLHKIISILCSEAKKSLREAGLHVPPWRTASYMQSKWLPNREPQVFGRGKQQELFYGEKVGNLSKLLVPPPDPLVIKPRRRSLGAGSSGSALSSQFSNLGINCC